MIRQGDARRLVSRNDVVGEEAFTNSQSIAKTLYGPTKESCRLASQHP